MPIRNFGYLYLAATPPAADGLRAARAVQRAAGTPTRLLTPDEIAQAYPFLRTDDLLLGSLNTRGEGYFEGGSLFDWLRRCAVARGVEYVAGEVVGLQRDPAGRRVTALCLAGGASVGCGAVVNATGPRAARLAAMAGIALPVEPRKRFSWVFRAATPLPGTLPLTIDPSGVHVRQDGPDTYLAGAKPVEDSAVAPDDLAMDARIWEERVWPVLHHRIPAFAALRVMREWAGHYAYNTLDQNAVLGPHPQVENFHFINGFSGHGLQQAPAMGRGLAERLVYGAYRSLDLSAFGYDRIAANRPMREMAVI